MNPSHIITGSANSSSTTFVYTHIDEDIYYAYSSGPIVYILKGASLKVVQVLTGHKSDITALSWLSYDSKLLTSSGSEIFLYTFNQSKIKWEKVFTLPNPFDVHTMAWLTPTSIIVCGLNEIVKWKIDIDQITKQYNIYKQQRLKELQLQKKQEQDLLDDDGSNNNNSSVGTSNFAKLNNYNTGSKTTTPPYGGGGGSSSFNNPITRVNNDKFLLDQKLKEQKIFDKQAQIIWRTDSASPIQHLSASPDGSLFATAGKYDRMLKVWFVQKTSNKNKLSQEEIQLNAQIQHLEYLQQQEQLQRKQKEKGLYKQQFNRLVNKEAVYTPPKKITTATDDGEAGSSASGATSPKLTTTKDNEPSLEEQQQQLQRLKDIINKKKNNKFETESYGFVYLPHPRSITWISWRSRVTSTHNILLTNCRDGVVRLWQQYPQSRRLQFNVSNIIPSGSDVIDWVHSLNEERIDIFAKKLDGEDDNNSSSSNNNSSSNSSNSKTGTTSNSNSSNSNSQDKDTNSYLRNHDLKLHLTNPILLRQKDSLAKTKPIVDWIVGVRGDGSLVLWKLRTDDSTTKQTSSLSIWTNSQILTPQEIGPNRIIALYQPVSLQDNTPLSVKVCFNSFNGAITSRRFFIQNQNNTQISNTSPASRCFGHRNPIKSLCVSRSNPFMASLDEKNNVVLWSSTNSSKIQSPFFIIDLASFPSINSVAWSPTQKYCFFSNREGIFVYCIETQDSGSSLSTKSVPLSVGQIQDSYLADDWFEEITLVEPSNMIYYNQLNDRTKTNVFLPYQFFLVALNKGFDKIYVWGVSIERDFRNSSASAPSILVSKLLATHEYERFSRLTCMCAAPKGISDRVLLPNPTAEELRRQAEQPTDRIILDQPIVVTGSVEGTVSLLSISPRVIKKKQIPNEQDEEDVFDLEDWEIKVMASYDAYKQPVESVKSAYYGRFASKPFSTNFNPEIHIWELESHTPKFKLEDTIKFFQPQEEEEKASKVEQTPITISLAKGSDSIQFSAGQLCMYSFAPLDNGSYSLAMGYGNQIKVLCRPVDRTIGSYKKPWTETHTFNHLSASCRAIEWGNDMTLYTASGNQILIFTKWNRPTNEHLYRSLQDSHSSSSLDSMYHQHSHLQRPLPVYHPKFLSEYMLAGKFNTVDKILNHLSKYLIEKYGDLDDIPKTAAHIPPMSLETLSSDTPIDSNDASKKPKAPSSLDDVDKLNSAYYTNNNDDDDYDDDDKDDGGDLLDLSANDGKFTKRIATRLNEILSTIKLANLTNNEQIQLLAVTDTYGEIGDMRGGLDENGSRFLIIAKIFQFLRRSLAPKDRPISLGTTDILWAMHSEAQETILQTIFPTDPDWEALKQIGAGLWIKSPSTLKDVVEKLARTTYQQSRQASECSLYYMALKKKGTLIALHKAAKDIKHVEFLQQDFTQPKWITAASKSAFLMQSKHRYEVAASLFLLAGQLKQAVNLIIQTTGDFQLALVISRLYEGENGEITKMIVEDHIIPLAKKSNDRSLMCICYWLLKRYEEAFTILIPSTPLDLNEKKLDDIDSYHSPTISGVSSPGLMHSGSGFRTSSASSPKPGTGNNNLNSGGVHQRDKQLSVQLKSSEMGPSVLYFFRFLRNHTLLRNICEDKKKEDPFLRNSAYSYSNSGCALLALENMKLLDSTRPPILTDREIEELDEKDRQDQESKYEREKTEKQKKQQQQSNSLGLDFGGGSSSTNYFNSSSYDMGLDFGGGSSSYKTSNTMGLDFGSPPKSTNNSMMGLDFGSPPKSTNNNSMMGLDFGSPPKSTNNNSMMGLDFGSPPKSNSNTMGLDFGSPPKSNSNTMGLDFGSPPKSNSNTMGLDFGSPPKSNSNTMGLDFGSPPKSSNTWSYDDKPTITTTDENNTTIKETTATSTSTDTFTFIKKERIGKEILSLYPLVDDELKCKLLVKLLIESLMEIRDSEPWSTLETDKIQSFVGSLDYLVEKYNLNRTGVVEQLIQSCFDRQYFFQCVLLTKMIGRNAIDYLETICTNIMKSIYRVDEDGRPVIKSQSYTTILTAIELYISYCEACKLDNGGVDVNNNSNNKNNSLILSTVYTTLFVTAWCASRFDILALLLEAHGKTSMDSMIGDLIKMSKIQKYTDDSMNYEMDTDEEDEAALINEDEAKKKAIENIVICKTLSNLFDLLVLKSFKMAYDQFFNNLAYHQVFDLIHQRVNLWIGTASAKLLVIPKPLTEIFSKKPQNTAGENLIEYIKSFPQFNTHDQINTWTAVTGKSETEVLENTILGPDHKKKQGIIGGGGSSSSGASSGTGRYRFEEEIELYRDSDLLQSFCIDPLSPDLSMMAIATTRGIREIDLKQNAHDSSSSFRDDFDMDNQLTETVTSPSSHSRKLRVSTKTTTTLHGAAGASKHKPNVFKSAISSLTKPVDHNMIVQCLESHPNSSYYLSGGIDGSVCLWQYGIPEVLTAYQLPQKPRIVRCKFNQSGTKFGACDIAGNLLLWQFAAQEDTLKPFYTLQAHSKQTLDFAFLNSGSLLATAGISSDSGRDVCLWDVLLPPNKSLIASYTDQENGAASIVYSPKRQTIIVGGKKGSITLYDIRTNKTLDSFKGHGLNTKTLALDPYEEFVCSGSSDGSIKVWSLPSLTCLNTFEDTHRKQTFVRPTGVFKSPVSTYGVMQVRLENNNIFSCGSDGRLLKRKYTKVYNY